MVLVNSEDFFLDGEDGECHPVVISVLLFLDGADGKRVGMSPAQVMTCDQHVPSKIAPDLTN